MANTADNMNYQNPKPILDLDELWERGTPPSGLEWTESMMLHYAKLRRTMLRKIKEDKDGEEKENCCSTYS